VPEGVLEVECQELCTAITRILVKSWKNARFQAKVLVILVCKLSFQFLLWKTFKIFSIELFKLETLYLVCCSDFYPWNLMVTVCTERIVFRRAA
jgi:hypothetical protein